MFVSLNLCLDVEATVSTQNERTFPYLTQNLDYEKYFNAKDFLAYLWSVDIAGPLAIRNGALTASQGQIGVIARN